MTQTVFYWVEDDGENRISDEEWEEIEHLQQRTNLLGYFHHGRLALVRFSYMPRWPELFEDSMIPETLSAEEAEAHVAALLRKGWSWEDLVHARLAARVSGGIHEGECLLAGESQVSDLPGDLQLVIRFLLKVSMIAKECTIRVAIEGPVAVPRLVIREGSITPDPAGVEEILEEHRKAGAEAEAARLLEAIESGDYLAEVGPAGVEA